MAAGVLFFDAQGRLLIVKPSYKDHWSIPGGVVDANESPAAAARREVAEEIHLSCDHLEFVCVDYMVGTPVKGDSIEFIFSGGQLDSDQVATLQLDNVELIDKRFCLIEEALPLLSATLARRLEGHFAGRRGYYMENDAH